ncbi:membrane bound lytic murein transglycosylase D [Legionella geestiana]|uniref:Membrane bound lytic murein transglycosylase D n=1 Tax=Legionella geestiana TaxID=45065 RepID=A0A0W0TY76_9GAMM|nr:LysM peptidoglycan-binding domain-containing protein [Legionella geestiana]KTD00738.1 membrane bound lytic murein transglycosylase D [Legionella geestiana]QBS11594.1 LysM peptidoglycan-binding domain-containing protein [Legionella geestiana]QDQ40797.1 LysM peptidoglycan-binding domain-containing protein [Legionella geestiana]STX53727.1 membrane bound lytic murein transglycosylase D [Legionella geestiana]
MTRKILKIPRFFLFFFTLFVSLSAGAARTPANVWDVLRNQFALNHELNQPEVQTQLRWLIAHPSYINRLTRQSEPYIYHVLTEIRKRNLPGEIALLPMIESAYDPFAYSGAGAAGLWQMMPGTGSNLGLKQDWWYDARRSIGPSTNAALNYLTYLNKFFHGNWLLAFAAYDSGEGTVARAIKNSRQNPTRVRFWTLPVPNETRAYVPRLLALAEVIKNPKRYGVELPVIPHVPYFEEVNIGSQIDLNHAARLAGISYKDLIRLNPGYNRWATAPYQPYKLLIPADRVQHFSRNLANLPEDKRVSWTRHQVARGDTVARIANRYHTTPTLVRQLNQLKNDHLQVGRSILIPNSRNTPPPPKPAVIAASHAAKEPPLAPLRPMKVLHIVQKTDTLARIAGKYGVPATEIQRWNYLSSRNPLKAGQQLVIWRKARVPRYYVVRPGDTLGAIAKASNTSLQNLTRLNPGLHPSKLRTGQRIAVA